MPISLSDGRLKWPPRVEDDQLAFASRRHFLFFLGGVRRNLIYKFLSNEKEKISFWELKSISLIQLILTLMFHIGVKQLLPEASLINYYSGRFVGTRYWAKQRHHLPRYLTIARPNFYDGLAAKNSFHFSTDVRISMQDRTQLFWIRSPCDYYTCGAGHLPWDLVWLE